MESRTSPKEPEGFQGSSSRCITCLLSKKKPAQHGRGNRFYSFRGWTEIRAESICSWKGAGLGGTRPQGGDVPPPASTAIPIVPVPRGKIPAESWQEEQTQAQTAGPHEAPRLLPAFWVSREDGLVLQLETRMLSGFKGPHKPPPPFASPQRSMFHPRSVFYPRAVQQGSGPCHPVPTGLPPGTSHEPQTPVTSSRDAASAPSAGTASSPSPAELHQRFQPALHLPRCLPPLPSGGPISFLQAGQRSILLELVQSGSSPRQCPAQKTPGWARSPGATTTVTSSQGSGATWQSWKRCSHKHWSKAARERSPGSLGDRETCWKVRNKWKP